MKKYIPLVLLLATMILGTAGYMMAGSEFYDALLKSLALVAFNNDIEQTNVLIEIARWTGILFAFDIIYTIVETAFRATAEDVVVRRRASRPDAVAVHGDGLFAEKLAEELGERGIHSEHSAALKAPYQVLLFSDDAQAVSFFNTHESELSSARETYLGLDGMNPDVQRFPNVYTFSMAEVCAQLYWADHPVNTPERIALIGEGAYAEALVTQGLLVNIFDIEGGVEYTLYGDFDSYCGLHTQLDKAVAENGDVLRVSEKPWYSCLGEFASFDRIILASVPSTNLETAAALQRAGVRAPLHIRCESETDLGLLQPAGDDSEIVAFGTSEQLCTQAIVLQQRQHDGGKICDIAYNMGTPACNGCTRQANSAPFATLIREDGEASETSKIKMARLQAADFNKCLSCPSFLAGWRAMDEFTKRSNYAAAAHDGHRMELLEACGAGRDSGLSFADLPLDERDRLQEIEHIRWNRYHRLNNWRYAPGDKDKVARTHSCLVPYSELSRKIKDYDGDSFITVWLRNR